MAEIESDQSESENVTDDDSTLTEPLQNDYPKLLSLFQDFTNEVNDTEKPSFHHLNEDCMHMIFSHFDMVDLLRICGVCRRWYNLCRIKIASTRVLQLNPTFSIFRLNNSLSQTGFITVLLMTGCNLRTLDLSESSLKLDSRCCKAIADCCPNLRELNFSKRHIDRKIAKQFSLHLPVDLKSLILERCDSLNEKLFKRIVTNAKSLEKLNLGSCSRINGLCIMNHLAANKIRHLDLSECISVKRNVISFILRQYCSTLEYLDISQIPTNTFAGINLDQEQIPQLSSLKTLIARYILTSPNSHSFIGRIMKLMPAVEHLDISGVNHADDWCFTDEPGSILRMMPNSCPNIQHLNLSETNFLSSKCLDPLADLKNLKELILNGIQHNDMPFNFVRFTECTLKKCQKIQHLAFRFTTIEDYQVGGMLANIPSLKKLDIRSCNNIRGLFISECEDLQRSEVQILTQYTRMREEDFPIIPGFMKIQFSLEAYPIVDWFGNFYDEIDELMAFPEEMDDEDYFDGGYYVDEAAQFGPEFFNEVYGQDNRLLGRDELYVEFQVNEDDEYEEDDDAPGWIEAPDEEHIPPGWVEEDVPPEWVAAPGGDGGLPDDWDNFAGIIHAVNNLDIHDEDEEAVHIMRHEREEEEEWPMPNNGNVDYLDDID